MRSRLVFTIKFILLFLPFITVSLFSKYCMMFFSDNEVPFYIWNRDFCSRDHDGYYDVLILGDSVANTAYDPTVLSETTANISLGGTTPVESYYIMKSWLENNKAPSDVFISFMDLHLEKSDCFWVRTMHSHRFSPKENAEILQNARNYKEDTVFTDHALMDYISYELYLPNKYITSISNAGINQRYSDNMDAYESVVNSRGRYLISDSVYTPADGIEYSEFTVSDLFDYYYRQLINMCISNNIRVHLVKLPLPSNSSFTDTYRDQLNSYYTDFINDYPETDFKWYDNDHDPSLFCDDCHMNTAGALYFDLELKEDYKEVFGSE